MPTAITPRQKQAQKIPVSRDLVLILLIGIIGLIGFGHTLKSEIFAPQQALQIHVYDR